MALTIENKEILSEELRSLGIEPIIEDLPGDFARIFIPIDEDTKLSGAAAALLPLQNDQTLSDRKEAAWICANSMLNVALKLQKLTEQTTKKLSEIDIIANAFLQRALSYHLCNIKLSSEGIQLSKDNAIINICDNYKTFPYTRSVYELLVMFYYLFILPESEEERTIAFNIWKINSERNVLTNFCTSNPRILERQKEASDNITNYKNIIFSTQLGKKYRTTLEECMSRPFNGSIKFDTEKDKISKLTYSVAWKYIFTNSAENNYEFMYKMLSMHCHPVSWGLSEFVSQSQNNDDQIIALHFSTIFIAKLAYYYIQHFKFTDFNKVLTCHQEGMFNSLNEGL